MSFTDRQKKAMSDAIKRGDVNPAEHRQSWQCYDINGTWIGDFTEKEKTQFSSPAFRWKQKEPKP